MCLNHDLCVFWVSSLAYPNSLGTKGYVVVVVAAAAAAAEIYLNSRNEMFPISQHVVFIFIRIIILLIYK